MKLNLYKIKSWMEDKNFNTNMVAKITKCHHHTITRILSGKIPTKRIAKRLIRISKNYFTFTDFGCKEDRIRAKGNKDS